LDRHKPL